MEKKQLTGPLKYLVGSITFAIVGIPLFLSLLFKGSLMALPVFTAIPIAGFLFYFWRLSKEGAVMPERGNTLFVTFLFSWLGLSFFVIGLKINDVKAIILGGLSFFFVTPLFIIELIRLIKLAKNKSVEKLEKVKKKYYVFVIIVFVLAGLSPVLLFVFYMFIKGQIITPLIILTVLGFLIWLFFKIKKN